MAGADSDRAIESEGPGPKVRVPASFRTRPPADAWVSAAPPANLTQSSGGVGSIVNAARYCCPLELMPSRELILHAAVGTPQRPRLCWTRGGGPRPL
jgi:hypothetical protein